MKEIRILWVARRKPILKQVKALRALYPGKEVVLTMERAFKDPSRIATRFKRGRYKDIVADVSLIVMQVLCAQHRILPLWPESVEVANRAQADFWKSGQGYRFCGFRRVESVSTHLNFLEPDRGL